MHLRDNHLLLMFVDEVLVGGISISLLSIDGNVDDVDRYPHSHMITMYFGMPDILMMVGLWRK